MLRKTRSALSEALALILVTSLSMSAFAGKDGTKGKPGGDDGVGGDPPTIGLPDQSTTPIQFSAAIFDAKADSQLDVPWSNAAEAWVYFDDVNTDGVACGQVYLPEEAGKGYGIIASVSEGVKKLTHLNDTFSLALESSDFAGLRIQGAWKINGIGQIACTLTDDASDDRPIAIADLRWKSDFGKYG